MTPQAPANLRSHPYRGLSVQEVEVPLDDTSIVEHLLGREVYRRTDFLALRNEGGVCLVAVTRASDTDLFSPVTAVDVLAGPDACRWVVDPDVDVGNATGLAKASRPVIEAEPQVRAVLVEGRFSHVNFIVAPTPLTVRVTEVVPPLPAKLFEQARQVVEFDEDLPPIALELDAVSIGDLAATTRLDQHLLLPCRGAGAEVDRRVSYLDTRPPTRDEWTMIGCDRSSQFHEHFYGDIPPRIELCPLDRHRDTETPVLAKCCMLERGVELQPGMAIVPWGANLDEVRLALRSLVGLDASPIPVVRRSEP